ncbi:MAG TPA: TetR/AcrR family transcriptional regulator [Acidimicrobiales bacterium]|nr:TetR/AcrR family transcriptional regulator [Acidimicrobiales bacterium]
MARKAGVASSDTKAQLIAAAAEVFAAKGYEGARVSDIAEAAGLSTGAVYAHYSGKADLLLHALAARSAEAVDRTVGTDRDSVLDALERSGSHLRTRRADPLLLLEGVTAGRREPELASVLRAQVAESRAHLAERVRAEQRDGSVRRGARPDAVAHLSLLLGLGALVADALELEPPPDDDWDAVIAGMVDSIRRTKVPATSAASPAA